MNDWAVLAAFVAATGTLLSGAWALTQIVRGRSHLSVHKMWTEIAQSYPEGSNEWAYAEGRRKRALIEGAVWEQIGADAIWGRVLAASFALLVFVLIVTGWVSGAFAGLGVLTFPLTRELESQYEPQPLFMLALILIPFAVGALGFNLVKRSIRRKENKIRRALED